MDMIITSLFCKLTKVSKNNFKIDIKGNPGRLKMCKGIIFVQICLYQPTRNFVPCCTRIITVPQP